MTSICVSTHTQLSYSTCHHVNWCEPMCVPACFLQVSCRWQQWSASQASPRAGATKACPHPAQWSSWHGSTTCQMMPYCAPSQQKRCAACAVFADNWFGQFGVCCNALSPAAAFHAGGSACAPSNWCLHVPRIAMATAQQRMCPGGSSSKTYNACHSHAFTAVCFRCSLLSWRQ